MESLKEKVSEEDVEDMIEVDQKQSQERLKQLGLDRAKREEEQRRKLWAYNFIFIVIE